MKFDPDWNPEITDYEPRLPMYRHQAQCFLLSRDRESFAFLISMGGGKSKVTIDTAAWLYEQGKIDALVVVAPNGLQTQWILQQIPTHLPDRIERTSAYWVSTPKKAEKEALDAVWTGGGLRILAMNIEGFRGDKPRKYLKKFMEQNRTLLVMDESTRIATPGAKQAQAMVNLGKYAKYRRILTGQPVPNGPLAFYNQFKFLGPELLGFRTYSAFKHRYAIFEQRVTRDDRKFDQLIQYKNIEELKEKVGKHAFRVRTEECVDLPSRIYETREVELGPEQKRMYKELTREGVASLTEGQNDPSVSDEQRLLEMLLDADNPTVEANNALSLLLRLQQILGNWATDSNGNVHPIEKTNRRLNALMETLQEVEGKTIVWARFRHELDEIEQALDKAGYHVVSYHGGVDAQARQEAVESFQSGEAQVFLGQPAAGGTGLNLEVATTMIFFSSDFSLDTREQAEARFYRIGSDKPVTIVDLVAKGTVDTKIAKALQSKAQTAREILDG